MPYMILLLTAALVLATALHLKYQIRKTAPIRQALNEARNSKTLTGLHGLRREK